MDFLVANSNGEPVMILIIIAIVVIAAGIVVYYFLSSTNTKNKKPTINKPVNFEVANDLSDNNIEEIPNKFQEEFMEDVLEENLPEIEKEEEKTSNNIASLLEQMQQDLDDSETAKVEKYEEEQEERKLWGRKNNNSKVVAMPQTQQVKMVISQPTTFDQAATICDLLKQKKSVIVNLEYVNKDVARRIVDFISGGVYALDGYIQKVSNSIFLVAPSNYEITNEMAREEIKNKLSVSWLKNNNVNN